MLKFSDLQSGDIVSESPYSTVLEVRDDTVVLLDTKGNETEIGRKYVEAIHSSADQFTKEKAVNRTEMIDIFLSNPRIACSVYFKKQDQAKGKRKLANEKKLQAEAVLQEIQSDPTRGLAVIADLVDNPILDHIPGEMRLMRGYHEGEVDGRGRIKFVDMEDNNVEKVVDPRTLEEYTVYNTKYTIKK